jgi:hypothetical protein
MNEPVSARKIMAIGITITYCLIMLGLTAMVIIGKVSVDVFLAALAGFAAQVQHVLQAYFNRTDRETNPPNNVPANRAQVTGPAKTV